MVVEALERAATDAAKNVWPGVRDTIQVVALVMWCLAWLVLAAIGWAFTYQPMITAGLAVPAVSVGAFKISRTVRRRRLRREAETSLAARARLERVKTAREVEATFAAFDLAHRQLRAALADAPSAHFELGGDIDRAIREAREKVFALAKRDAALVADLRSLSRLERTTSVSAASERASTELRRVRSEADEVTASVQALAERVTDMRALSGAELPAGRAAVGEVIEAIDRTALAYREIDEAEERRDPDRMRARLRAERIKT